MTRRLLRLPLTLLPLALACGGTTPAPATTVEVPPTAAPTVATEQPSLESACSRGTGHLLASLQAPLEVTVWVTTGTPKLAAFARALDDLFIGYEKLAPGKIRHRVAEAKTGEQQHAAKEAGLQESFFGEAEGETAELHRGFMGVAFAYRGEKEVIPSLDADAARTLPFWVANKIREIQSRADHTSRRVAVLAGKDEIKLTEANLTAAQGTKAGPTLEGILEQALPFYKIEEADLRGGQGEVDPEAAALVVTQPGRDLTEKELRRIDQFLMRGRSVAVFAGAVNVKPSDAAMTAQLDAHGLDKLLDGYGIELRRDALLDWESAARIKVTTQGAPVTLRYPAVTIARPEPRAAAEAQPLDPTFPGFFRMEELAFPFPSTLVLHAERQPGAALRAVARTSSRATSVTAEPLSLKPARELERHGEQGRRVIAAALEGKIRSAFAGREDRAVPAPAESAGRGKLLVVASSQFLANPLARAGNPPPMPPQMAMMGAIGGDEELMLIAQPYTQQYLTATILAFKNTLDWMTSDEDLIACSALLAAK